ncbi:MAG: hypothetical protein A2Z14_02745 [Chloroflexi bacterium RBG_16_48_8]|nr:MAG: hypothetical protein A2Z14_02745 [Chloroflexi bacterium RBG_16_48_8]
MEGNRLALDRPLYIDFDPELNPVIRPNGLIANVGIEDLHIRRLDAGIDLGETYLGAAPDLGAFER